MNSDILLIINKYIRISESICKRWRLNSKQKWIIIRGLKAKYTKKELPDWEVHYIWNLTWQLCNNFYSSNFHLSNYLIF